MEAMHVSHEQLVFLWGVLGNIIAFFVFLAPVPTFLKIYKQKSTLEYSAIPYSVALFSAMLTLYYGFCKHDHGLYLITINSIGVCIQSFYLAFYMFFATRRTRVRLMKLIVLFNMSLFGGIILFTFLLTHGPVREKVVGFLVAIFSICVFASPLSVMRKVIITKNAGPLPAGLSLCLTMCALVWLVYGFVIGDLFILIPNVLGLLLGIGQTALYLLYRNNTTAVVVVVDPKTESTYDSDLHLSTKDDAQNNTVKILMEVQVTPTTPAPLPGDVVIVAAATADGNVTIEDVEENQKAKLDSLV